MIALAVSSLSTVLQWQLLHPRRYSVDEFPTAQRKHFSETMLRRSCKEYAIAAVRCDNDVAPFTFCRIADALAERAFKTRE